MSKNEIQSNNNSILDIEVYPTSIKFKMKDPHTLENGISIDEFVKSLITFVFNFSTNKWMVDRKYGIWNDDTGIASIPRYYLKYFVDYVRYYGGNTHITHAYTSPGRDVLYTIDEFWKPRDYQLPVIDFLAGVPTLAMKTIPLSTGSGKALPNRTPLKIPHSWTTIGDVAIGDTITTPDGHTATVTGKYPQGKKDIYRITFLDGRTSECDKDHLWEVIYYQKGNKEPIRGVFTTLEIKTLMKDPYIGKRMYIPIAKSEQCKSILLPDPYLIGSLIRMDIAMSYIPMIYFSGSHEQRLELLRGIMDIDRFIANSNIRKRKHNFCNNREYITTHKPLALDIQQLVWSLGGICRVTSRKYHHTTQYRVYARFDSPEDNYTTLQLQSKKVNPGADSTHWKLRIKSIRKLPVQEECTCIAIDDPKGLYVVKNYITTHNTVITLFAIARLHKVALIIAEGLINQWHDVIFSGRNDKPAFFKNLLPHEVYTIQGQDSLVKLIEHPEIKPKILLGSMATMRNYVAAERPPYSELPDFNTLAQRLGIGIKVFDEAHRCFSTIVDIDLRSNIAQNWYPSATLTRGDRQSKKIYKKVFPSVIEYQDTNTINHIQMYYLPYDLGFINQHVVSSFRYGYNQNKYENVILNDYYKKHQFLQFIQHCVAAYYIHTKRPGQRCLVMANTRSMCEALSDALTLAFPELKVGLYVGESDESVLTDNDIIVSTVKKGGTGTDIAQLKTMINTISIGSEVLVNQVPGRLRPLEGDTPIYVAMYNKTLDKHVQHYHYCRNFYKKRAKELIDLTVIENANNPPSMMLTTSSKIPTMKK